MPYPVIVTDNITALKAAVWHAGEEVETLVPWNSSNAVILAAWTFTENDLLASIDLSPGALP